MSQMKEQTTGISISDVDDTRSDDRTIPVIQLWQRSGHLSII